MPPPFRVFIGHGGDGQWRDLKDSLRDQHHFDVDAFEAMTRTSQVISQIVQGMAEGSTAAVLVFTKADEMKDGTWRARQNVVHEAGYFQGRLGWERTILVVEEGVVLPSNFDGTQHIGFPSGVISAAEGRVAAALQAIRNRPFGICP
jgi:predicted nucleotide-binding protein